MNATRIKKAGKAVAGSALLVGATLTGAAGLAAASSHNSGSSGDMSGDMSLADYPTPFVGEDGTVNTAIVVGEQAATIDVVGAINIAGSLGNQAFTTEQVSAEGGSFGFSATQGVTLTTANDNLYYGDSLNEVRDTLTADQLDSLGQSTFSDDGGEDTDIEYFLYPSPDQTVEFGKPDDRDDEDPIVHVENPEDPDEDDYLYRLQANFEESIDFTDSEVQDEDIELFGQEFTISTDTDTDELILNGARDTTSVSASEEPVTLTIGGEEVTIGVVGVTASNRAAISVNGEVQEEEEEDEFTVNGETVRLDDIIQTNSDNSQGTVQFAVGSQQFVFQDEQQVEDEDGDEIEGAYVEFQGSDTESLEGLDLYVGAEDDDRTYVAAGETYAHSLFPDYTFRFGGLNPNTAGEEVPEGASEVEYEASGDETITASLDGDSIEILHDSNLNNDPYSLADDDGDTIHSYEGAVASEDEYFAADAGDFAHLFEVTSIDRDETGSDIDSGDEATVDLQDAITGDTIEVDLDAATTDTDGDFSDSGEGEYYADTEIIDGQTYKFVVEGDDSTSDGNTNERDSDTLQGNTGEPELQVVFGDGSKVAEGGDVPDIGNNLNPGDEISNYAALDTDSNAAVSLYQVHNPLTPFKGMASEGGDGSAKSFDGTSGDSTETIQKATSGSGVVTVEVPSTESTDKVTQEVTVGEAAAFTSNGGLTHSFGFVPLEQTDSSKDSIADDFADDDSTLEVTYNNDGSTSDVEATVQVLYADGDTDTAEFDFSSSSATKNLDTGTAIGIAVHSQSNAEDADSIDIEGEEVVADPTTETGDADNKIRAVAADDQLERPAAFTIEPEDDNDNEEAYVVGGDVDTDDEEIDVNFVGFTGTNRDTATLESNDDVDAGLDFFGTYSEEDSDEQGSFTLRLPAGQAAAGAALTREDGDLSTGGGSSSVESQTPTGFPEGALLDSEVTSSQRQNTNHILVGGPAVNTLVADLAEANKTMAGSEYSEGDSMIQLVEDSFAEGANSLIVSGFSGEDTRQAANRLANADENPLPGQDQVMVGTGQ